MGGGCHCLGRGELGVFIQIAHDAHGRAFVHHCLDRGGKGYVFDVKFGHRQTVFGQGWADLGHDQFAQVRRICGHIQHWNTTRGNDARKFLDDDVADLETDFIHREFPVRADDFGQKPRSINDADCLGPKGTDAGGAEFWVAYHDGIFGAPFQIPKSGRIYEIDFGFERAFEPVIPMI